MTNDQEKDLKNVINKVLENYPKTVEKYKNGQRGLIGLFMKRVIKKSTISFYSKESKQKLVLCLKNHLSDKKEIS